MQEIVSSNSLPLWTHEGVGSEWRLALYFFIKKWQSPSCAAFNSWVMNKLLAVLSTPAAFSTVWMYLLIHCSLKRDHFLNLYVIQINLFFIGAFPETLMSLGNFWLFYSHTSLKILFFHSTCLCRTVDLKVSLLFLIIADISLSSLLFWSHQIPQHCNTKLLRDEKID